MFRDFFDEVLPGVGSFKIIDLKIRAQSISRRVFEAFDGMLELVDVCNVLSVKNGLIEVTEQSMQEWRSLDRSLDFGLVITQRLLSYIDSCQVYNPFVSMSTLTFNPQIDSYTISNADIPTGFLPIRHFFVESGILIPDISTSTLTINNAYWSVWQKLKLVEIAKSEVGVEKLKGMTIEQLLELKEYQRELGRQAEAWVLEFEKKRLYGHRLIDKIKIISEYSVNSGYDIVSFHDLASEQYDRFIEVKSFNKQIGFYWSRNELKVAKKIGCNYYVYLIDRSRLDKENYEPTLIENAYSKIFLSESFTKTAETYHIRKKN